MPYDPEICDKLKAMVKEGITTEKFRAIMRVNVRLGHTARISP